MKIISIIFLTLLLSPSLSFGYPAYPESEPDPFMGLSDFNGMNLKQFGGFTAWQLVTVRFRKDTQEMRFVYANPTAWKELRLGTKKYSDGAIFAKIGIKTEEDSAFPSSAIPSGAARFQFMVKDKSKYSATDGWGYAIFDSQGKTLGGEPKAAVMSCHACHRLVPERDFVFSTPLPLSALVSQKILPPPKKQLESNLKWLNLPAKDLPQNIRSLLPKGTNSVSIITGDLQKNIFVGTLDEIRPALIAKVKATGKPAALFSADGKVFTVLFHSKRSPGTCPASQSEFEYHLRASAKQLQVSHKTICQ